MAGTMQWHTVSSSSQVPAGVTLWMPNSDGDGLMSDKPQHTDVRTGLLKTDKHGGMLLDVTYKVKQYIVLSPGQTSDCLYLLFSTH